MSSRVDIYLVANDCHQCQSCLITDTGVGYRLVLAHRRSSDGIVLFDFNGLKIANNSNFTTLTNISLKSSLFDQYTNLY